MRDATLCFLIRRNAQDQIHEVLLAMKKRGFGEGHWNGTGGKVHDNETIEEAMVRETEEEVRVAVQEFGQVAEIRFPFLNNPEWNQLVHVYISDKWAGEPTETEEMYPQWFEVGEIPYDRMWSDDEYWLPQVLGGKKIKAEFVFTDQENFTSYSIEEVVGF